MKLKLHNAVGLYGKIIAPPADGSPISVEDKEKAQSLIDRGAAEKYSGPLEASVHVPIPPEGQKSPVIRTAKAEDKPPAKAAAPAA